MPDSSQVFFREPASPAGDSDSAEIHALAATLDDLHRQKATSLAPIVQNLLDTRSRDEKEIEHTLDHLLDCACIPEGLALFKALCRHYNGINPSATATHVYAYRDMWDSDEAPHQEVAS